MPAILRLVRLIHRHAALDPAMLEAYGFDAPPRKDLLMQLPALNLAVAKRIDRDEPVVSPGVPPIIPNLQAACLVTDDCIRA